MKILKLILLILFLLIPFNFVSANTLININTASLEELQTLTGIGPAYAGNIIDYRENHGPFINIEDIENVSGIGPATFSNIKDYITVGDVDIPDEPEDDEEDEDEEEDSEEDIIPPVSGGSAHSSPAPLVTTSPPKPKLEVSAGRHRLGVAGAPLVFQADIITEKDLSSGINYDWSMGDGFIKNGQEIEHIYEFPGTYEIVLNSSGGDIQSVSRIKVKIVSPDIAIIDLNHDEGFFVLENKSSEEINLGGWKIKSGSSEYIFPADTIIATGSELILSLALLAEQDIDDDLALYLPTDEKVVDYLPQQILVEDEVVDKIVQAIENIQKEEEQERAREAENDLALMRSRVEELEKKLVIEEEVISEKEEVQDISLQVIKPETALVGGSQPSLLENIFQRALFWR